MVDDFAIFFLKNDYRIHYWYISKDEALYLFFSKFLIETKKVDNYIMQVLFIFCKR